MNIYVCSDIGGRSHMEDTSCLEKNFGGNKNWHFGGVFDGHVGACVSMLAAEKMPEIFLEKIKSELKPEKSFKKSFLDVSKMADKQYTGCTALAFFIRDNDIWIANAGDGRMINVRKKEISQITNDHQANNESEKARILKLGGEIKGCYIMRGKEGLMPTRSLGDEYFRPVGIIPDPEVFHRKIRKDTIGFVLATDGLWEAMTNEAVGEILKETKTAKEAAELIRAVYIGIEPRYMLDNMTVMAIKYNLNAS